MFFFWLFGGKEQDPAVREQNRRIARGAFWIGLALMIVLMIVF